MAFVSLTSDSREKAAWYVNHFGVPWACGFRAPGRTILGLKAAVGVVKYGPQMIKPVVYLVGPDGRVLWSDRCARFGHKGAEEMLRELTAALEAALAAGPIRT